MKLPKISYSDDVDILMIQFSNKKLDDAYDVGNMIVRVAQDKEPVLLEIFDGRKFLKDASYALSSVSY
ncbi:MAG: hypothetical protein UR81_C0038G0005 [Candidatus Levybacteria bacterium GW2011_GWB1_35_5]|nr:MAG: hypothetical protein UR81_C0038G0005 [Candidatus Levybacteria bacterium GW2011_GWB1_35_5]